jgi:LysM repeat protein
MKILSLLALMLTVSSAVFGQEALYVIYDDACMNKLDYRYASGSSNTVITTYALTRNQGAQLLLMDVGLENDKKYTSVPKSAVRCSAVTDMAALGNQINTKGKSVYIVRKRAEGDYTITPVSSAGYMQEQGDEFEYTGYKFGFKANAASSDFAQNLTNRSTDAGFIFLKSREANACKRSFKFTYEPNSACACGEGSTFQFVAGLGFLREENSTCSTDVPKNGLQLVSVDGRPVDEAMSQMCAGETTLAAVQVAPDPVMSAYVAPAPAPVMHNTSAKSAKISGKPVNETAWTSAGPITEVVVEPAKVVVAPSAPFGPPAPPVACNATGGPGLHVVHKGETLYAISRAYGVPVKSLQAWNKLKNANQVQLCQVLVLTDPKAKAKPAAIASAPKPKAVAKAIVQKKPVTKAVIAQAKAKAVAKPQAKMAVATKKPVTTPVVASAPKPVEHSTGGPAPVTHSTTLAAVSTTSAWTAKADTYTPPVNLAVMHTVASGESLYTLAKRYGFSTERFARMNGLDENSMLAVGQQLITTDCTCPVERGIVQESSAKSVAPVMSSTGTTVSAVSADAYYYKQPVEHTNVIVSDNTTTTTTWSQEINPDDVPSTYTYEAERPTEYSTANTVEAGYTMGGPPVSKETIVEYYVNQPIKTHMVAEGDSLEYLARKYKTTAARIREWNSIEPNGVLINGQLLIVQR